MSETMSLSLARHQKEDSGYTWPTSEEAHTRLVQRDPNALPEPGAGRWPKHSSASSVVP